MPIFSSIFFQGKLGGEREERSFLADREKNKGEKVRRLVISFTYLGWEGKKK